MDDINDSIDRFYQYFLSQIDEIGTIQSRHGELYRKLLFVGVLDVLAKTTSRISGNKARFVAFVRRHCAWEDGRRVSLPHLIRLLERSSDPLHSDVRAWARDAYQKQSVHHGALMPITEDPSIEEVENAWQISPNGRRTVGDISLDSLCHYNLLYEYRNALVHELRTPGYGMEFGNKDLAPYYHGMSAIQEDNVTAVATVELVYPWRFLSALCSAGLQSSRNQFHNTQTSPYDSFAFGSYWVPALNKGAAGVEGQR